MMFLNVDGHSPDFESPYATICPYTACMSLLSEYVYV